jgi:hypothetical protein
MVANPEGEMAREQQGKRDIAEGVGHIDFSPPHEPPNSVE